MADNNPSTPRRLIVDIVETAAELPLQADAALEAELLRHDPADVRALVEGSNSPESLAVLTGLMDVFRQPGFPVVDGLSADDALVCAQERADADGTDGPVAVLMAPVDEVLWDWVARREA
ncbi:hypothetical protein AAK967_05800 [Atopobiaceae bacterium 24-176]